MNALKIVKSIDSETIPKMSKNPLFTKPSAGKMTEQEIETETDDQINTFEQLCKQVSSKSATKDSCNFRQMASIDRCSLKMDAVISKNKSESTMTIVKHHTDSKQNMSEIIVEINAIAPVVRGLWKSVSLTSKTIFV